MAPRIGERRRSGIAEHLSGRTGSGPECDGQVRVADAEPAGAIGAGGHAAEDQVADPGDSGIIGEEPARPRSLPLRVLSLADQDVHHASAHVGPDPPSDVVGERRPC